MLTGDPSGLPIAALRLDLDPEGLGLDAEDGSAALEQGRVDVRGADEGVVPRAQSRRAVEPQDVPRQDVVHEEGQADAVAFGHEVRAAVDQDGDVVRGLRAEKREELGYG
ncbi:hypothetical protein PC116_g32632, partial [Phytophthora cactorum]